MQLQQQASSVDCICVCQVAALLYRPGRLDKILYVPLPPPEGRGAILQALTRQTPLAVDVDVAAVGASPHCHGFSGADLAALVREACICALKVCFPQSSTLRELQLEFLPSSATCTDVLALF